MRRCDIEGLDPHRTWWVPAVVAPERDWPGSPGCRKGARFMVNCDTLRVTRDEFEVFDSHVGCLQWIMRHRAQLNRSLPRVPVRAVALDRWLLGLE